MLALMLVLVTQTAFVVAPTGVKPAPRAVVPAAPALVSPANNATNVSASPTFVWGSAAGATSYDLQVAEFSNFAALVYEDLLIPTTSYTVNYLPQFSEIGSLTFYWRVRGRNASATGPWSAVRSFSIDPNHVPPPIPALPHSGTINHPTTLTLQWSPPPTSDWQTSTYVLQVSTSYSFAVIVNQQTVAQVGTGFGAATVSGLAKGTTYYWRVSATISGRASGGWSTPSQFTTAH
jgi:hypothetical protein